MTTKRTTLWARSYNEHGTVDLSTEIEIPVFVDIEDIMMYCHSNETTTNEVIAALNYGMSARIRAKVRAELLKKA